MKWFQDELPRSYRGRVTDWARSPGDERFDEVRNELMAGPVAATDRVAGTHAGDCHLMVFERLCCKERISIRACHKLGAALRIRVGIMAAHGFVLTISPDPFAVGITFVAGHI